MCGGFKSTSGLSRAKGEKTSGRNAKASSGYKPFNIQLHRLASYQKKNERACCSARSKCKDSSPSTSSSSLSSSFSTANTEPKTGVELVVSHIVYEKEEEEDIATNLRVGFKERQRKRLSESITVNPASFKKPCQEPICMDPISALTSMPVPLTTVGGIIPDPDEMLPSA